MLLQMYLSPLKNSRRKPHHSQLARRSEGVSSGDSPSKRKFSKVVTKDSESLGGVTTCRISTWSNKHPDAESVSMNPWRNYLSPADLTRENHFLRRILIQVHYGKIDHGRSGRVCSPLIQRTLQLKAIMIGLAIYCSIHLFTSTWP